MSILKLAPAAVTSESAQAAIRQLIANDASVDADSKYLFSIHPEHGSVVVSGKDAGMPLSQWIDDKGWDALGSDARSLNTLPFTIRDLGVENGQLFFSPKKKSKSFWYIDEAPQGASIYFGVNDSMTPAEFDTMLKDGSWKEKLEQVDAVKGDIFTIEAGTAYVFPKGIRIVEFSDTEPSASDQMVAVDDSRPEPIHHDYHENDWVADGQAERVCAGRTSAFELDLFEVNGRLDMNCDDKSFKVIVFVDGDAVVDDHDDTIHCQKDTVLFAPANTDTFHITGNCRFALVHLVG